MRVEDMTIDDPFVQYTTTEQITLMAITNNEVQSMLDLKQMVERVFDEPVSEARFNRAVDFLESEGMIDPPAVEATEKGLEAVESHFDSVQLLLQDFMAETIQHTISDLGMTEGELETMFGEMSGGLDDMFDGMSGGMGDQIGQSDIDFDEENSVNIDIEDLDEEGDE